MCIFFCFIIVVVLFVVGLENYFIVQTLIVYNYFSDSNFVFLMTLKTLYYV